MISVKVPATSANLGVGYDCLGIALSEYAYVDIEDCDELLIIKGCDEEYCNEDNLIYQAFVKACKYMNKDIPYIKMNVNTNIPYARGMGSSATCIVAGMMLANAYYDNQMSIEEVFTQATFMEGHPDNIAPCIFGGLVVSFVEDDRVYHIKYPVDEKLNFVMIIPDYEVSTKAARKVLPNTMSYSDAIYQMGRIASLCKAMELGDELLIQKASVDRMQEPYRKKLIPEYDEIKKLCMKHNMITMLISGSGSTLMAINKDMNKANELKEAVIKQYPNFDCRILKCNRNGSRVEVIK